MILYNIIKNQFTQYYNHFHLDYILKNKTKFNRNDLDNEIFRLKDGKIISKNFVVL